MKKQQYIRHLESIDGLRKFPPRNERQSNRWAIYLRGREIAEDTLAHMYLIRNETQMLVLSDSNVRDEFLNCLGKMEDVDLLELRNTAVTDMTIPKIAKLSKLEALDLAGTKVSLEGVELLQQVLPNCEIDWGPTSKIAGQIDLPTLKRKSDAPRPPE